MYKVISFRGSDLGNNLKIKINEKQFHFPISLPNISDFNVRLIFQIGDQRRLDAQAIFGKMIFEQDDFYTGRIIDFNIENIGEGLDLTSFPSLDKANKVSCKIFSDVPVNQFDVLAAIPLPTNMLTILFVVSDRITEMELQYDAAKYFDAFSHMGFCMTDLKQLNEVISTEYPDEQDIDLAAAFAQTDLIDKLFERGIIIVAWGFNPYTYPIYSIKKDDELMKIFGEVYDGEVTGIYKINNSISELSVIPGNELKSWKKIKERFWPSIPVFGKGEKVILQPRKLIDHENGKTTIVSFVLYREDGGFNQTVPLLNMDLLYS